MLTVRDNILFKEFRIATPINCQDSKGALHCVRVQHTFMYLVGLCHLNGPNILDFFHRFSRLNLEAPSFPLK